MRSLIAVAALLLLLPSGAATAPIVFSSAGAGAASIQATVDAFRAALGTQNPNVPGSFGSGRREINWDGVPPPFTSPNAFPGDFFNQPTPGRARGAEFTTPGTSLQNSASPPEEIEFGNINPTYPSIFDVFSANKLFTPIGSNIVDVTFFIPGSSLPATSHGFGAVFTDVDLPAQTSLQFFGLSGVSLGTFFVQPFDMGLSFLGVAFNAGERIHSVRITNGNTALGPNDGAGVDVVVNDDFIFGEPVPEPSVVGLVGLGLAALAGLRLRK
jgi:hypothetical protein